MISGREPTGNFDDTVTLQGLADNPLPWPKQPGGLERYKSEMSYLRQALKPSLLKASLTRAQDVVIEIETALQPSLTLYLKTGVRYPYVGPELVAVKNGKEVELSSATLRSWDANCALYQVCQDAQLVKKNLIKPQAALVVGGVILVLLLIVWSFSLVAGKANQPDLDSSVKATLTAMEQTPEAGGQTNLPYELNIRAISSQSEYEGLLRNYVLDSALVKKNRLLLVVNQPVEAKTRLRAINQTTGRVRLLDLPDKRNATAFDNLDSGCQSGHTCEFVLIKPDGNSESSEPLVVSRFYTDRFYILSVNVTNSGGTKS